MSVEIPYIEDNDVDTSKSKTENMDIVKTLKTGAGDQSIRTDVNQGFWIGSEQFDTAPFRIDMKGNTVANSLTISGGSTIDFANVNGLTKPDDNADVTSANTSADSNKVQGYTIISGGKISTGLLTADNIQTGTLTGRTVQTASSGKRVMMNTDGTYANELSIYDDSGLRVKVYENAIYWFNEDVLLEASNTTELTIGFPVPASDPSYLYVSRLSGGEVKINTGGGDIYFDKNILPYSSHNLGSSSYKWNNAYLGNDLSVGGGITLGGTYRTTWPTSSFSCSDLSSCSLTNLGTKSHADLTGVTASQHHTKTAYSSELTFNSDIIPSSDLSYDLGSSSYSYDNLYFDSWYLPNGDTFLDYDSGNTSQMWCYKNIVPITDNAKTLGSSDHRWSDVRSVLINGSDYGFANKWYLTENDRVGIEEKGIAVLNSKNELKLFIGESGIYVKGGNVKNLDLLAYIKTTLKQRAQMDSHPELRKRTEDVEALEFPDTTKAKIGGAKYIENKIILKKNEELKTPNK